LLNIKRDYRGSSLSHLTALVVEFFLPLLTIMVTSSLLPRLPPPPEARQRWIHRCRRCHHLAQGEGRCRESSLHVAVDEIKVTVSPYFKRTKKKTQCKPFCPVQE
jgi:hypothetical protein